jgi:hypothetical protein
LRRGFKKAARSVTGQEKASPKNKIWDWILTA